jgi:hypothetical protein
MFMSYGELLFMFCVTLGWAIMTLLLFVANYRLLNENRYLKSRLRAWRKACATRHAEVPF